MLIRWRRHAAPTDYIAFVRGVAAQPGGAEAHPCTRSPATTAPLFKNLIFTVLIPGTFGVYLPMAIARATGAKAAGAGFFWLAGFGLLMLGALIYLVCVMEFAVRGRGTPAPIDAPKRLVVSGLYHYVRNPMYVGVLAVVLDLPPAHSSCWATLRCSPSYSTRSSGCMRNRRCGNSSVPSTSTVPQWGVGYLGGRTVGRSDSRTETANRFRSPLTAFQVSAASRSASSTWFLPGRVTPGQTIAVTGQIEVLSCAIPPGSEAAAGGRPDR
jgi:hypothetical protein